METIILVISIVLLVFGIIGSIIPVLPGPPLVYISILILHFCTDYKFSNNHLITWGLIVVIITIIENFVQFYGVKLFGGNQKAFWGSILGFFIGLVFIPIPFGALFGSFLGALIGALIENNFDYNIALKVAMGAIVGIFASTVLKLSISIYLTFHYFSLIHPALRSYWIS